MVWPFPARFAAEVGKPPMAYLNSIRTDKAAELLLGTKMPIGEIASRTGFVSLHYFHP